VQSVSPCHISVSAKLAACLAGGGVRVGLGRAGDSTRLQGGETFSLPIGHRSFISPCVSGTLFPKGSFTYVKRPNLAFP
jgi:hypothetical protein